MQSGKRRPGVFSDATLSFSDEEWLQLSAWQRDLYTSVMKDTMELFSSLDERFMRNGTKADGRDWETGGESPGSLTEESVQEDGIIQSAERALSRDSEGESVIIPHAERALSRDSEGELAIIPRAERLLSRHSEGESVIIPRAERALSRDSEGESAIIPRAEQALSRDSEGESAIIPRAERLLSRDSEGESAIIPRAERLLSRDSEGESAIIPRAERPLSREGADYVGRSFIQETAKTAVTDRGGDCGPIRERFAPDSPRDGFFWPSDSLSSRGSKGVPHDGQAAYVSVVSSPVDIGDTFPGLFQVIKVEEMGDRKGEEKDFSREESFPDQNGGTSNTEMGLEDRVFPLALMGPQSNPESQFVWLQQGRILLQEISLPVSVIAIPASSQAIVPKDVGGISGFTKSARRRGGAGKYYSCATCERRFLYKMHLVRHEKTHKPTQSFSCATSRKEFALSMDPMGTKETWPERYRLHRFPKSVYPSRQKTDRPPLLEHGDDPELTGESCSELHQHLQLSTVFLQNLISSTGCLEYD
ncbi:uncharacterized protein LOC128496790 [Spea bombifrons]|uniref:uncharacterized protein LOC128496790 n=1 Tax=Spea bombifrons TaxID=233779 RepID=UPI00234A0B65|nr:uncharacterized protein LOC128496790 [Spea bombifrons]